MPLNPPAGSQHVVPYVYYEDPAAAVEYLVAVFGFTQTMLLTWPDGNGIAHAEVSLHGERVLIGTNDQQFAVATPQQRGSVHTLLAVYVADVDAHYRRALQAGAEIVQDIADMFYGDRAYTARDPEGHLWAFREHRRDVTDAELQAAIDALAARLRRPG